MKLATIALAAAFALRVRPPLQIQFIIGAFVRTDRDAAHTVQLHPNYGNPNGNPDGPTTLSGTGNSAVRRLLARYQRLQLRRNTWT